MNERERLGRNFGSVTVAQVTAQALAFVVSIVIARGLGVESYGIFVFSFAFPSWFLLLVSLGLDSVLTIDVAADKDRAARYLTSVTLLRLPLVGLALVALWVSVHLFLTDPLARTVTLIIGSATLISTFGGTFSSLFRAFERLEYAALVTVFERALTTVGVILLLWLGWGLIEVSFVFLAGAAVTVAFSLVLLRRGFTWFDRRVEWDRMRAILRKTVPFALGAVVSTFMFSTGPVLLTFLDGPRATGYFNSAFALVLVALAPFSIYSVVFLPTMSRTYREERGRFEAILHNSQRLFFMIAFPVALGGWFYAEGIVTLVYGEAFRQAAASLGILVFSVAVSAAVLGIGTGLAAADHQDISLAIGSVGTGANVALCFLLIPRFGHVGAALAFLSGALLTAGLGAVAADRLLVRPKLRKTLSRPAVAGLVMMVALLLLPPLPLLWGAPVGGAVYFGVLAALGGITQEDLALAGDLARGVLMR